MRNIRSRLYVTSISFLLMWFACSSLLADTLYLSSAGDDYIGQGVTRTLEDPAYTFTATQSVDNSIQVSLNNGTEFWNVEFSAPNDAVVATGNYEDATRYPFQSPTVPGLDVGGDGRGCNTLTGRFVIWEVAYDGGGNVTNLAADFIQYCGGSTSPLHGAVRINSTVPVLAVAPNAIAGRDKNVLELNSIQLDGSLSTAGDGFTITDYAWTQISGSTVPLIMQILPRQILLHQMLRQVVKPL